VSTEFAEFGEFGDMNSVPWELGVIQGPGNSNPADAEASRAVLEQYEATPYALRLRLRFVLKRRMCQARVGRRLARVSG
jgi:hypothetical protein